MIELRVKDDTLFLRVRVNPRASQTIIRGEIDGCLKIALAASPVDGAANAELVRFIAGRLGVGRDRVAISAGLTSRNKVIAVKGVGPDEARRALSDY